MSKVSRLASDQRRRARLLAARVVAAVVLVPAVARGEIAAAPPTTVSPLGGAATPAPFSADERARLLEQIRQLEQKVADLEAERGDAARAEALARSATTVSVATRQASPAGPGAAQAPEAVLRQPSVQREEHAGDNEVVPHIRIHHTRPVTRVAAHTNHKAENRQ